MIEGIFYFSLVLPWREIRQLSICRCSTPAACALAVEACDPAISLRDGADVRDDMHGACRRDIQDSGINNNEQSRHRFTTYYGLSATFP